MLIKVLTRYGLIVGIIIFALIAFLLAYRPTLFNFFLADDFIYLTWADEAWRRPEILAEKYFGVWTGWLVHAPYSETVYRPLVRAIMLLEYKLWGVNGLFFRLVNVALELLTGLMLGLVIANLSTKSIRHDSSSNRRLQMWGLFSAAFFVLYPLHSEAVNWITAVINPVVTLLSLLSLWCYIRWRDESKRLFMVLAIISAAIAFLSKEMAVALPFTVLLYELLFGQSVVKSIRATNTFIGTLRRSVIATMPYWLILVLYFCWRKVLLGDFIAGYPDYLCYPTISGWMRGLRDIFIPVNNAIISSHSPIFKTWHIVLFIMVLSSVVAAIRANKEDRKTIYFLAAWFLLALAPTYKVFPTLMSCATGSRLAYLATAPVCAFLTYGLATFSVSNGISLLFLPLMIVVLAFESLVLYENNLAWAEAGRWTNKVVQEFKNYYDNVKGDPLVYVIGLPMSKMGILSVGILEGITKRPMLNINSSRCARLDYDEQYVDAGALKDAVVRNHKQIKVLYWDSQIEVLKPVTFPANDYKFARRWQSINLRQIIRIPSSPQNHRLEMHWLSDGTLELLSKDKMNTFAVVELDLAGLPCLYVDFLALKVQLLQTKPHGFLGDAELLFTNDIAKEYSKQYTTFYNCHSRMTYVADEQNIIFPLRGIPAWSMGGRSNGIRISLPIERGIKVKEILIPDMKQLIPCVYLQSLSNDPPGQIRLDCKQPVQYVHYDVLSIKGRKQVMLEVVPVDTFFGAQNDPQKVKREMCLRKTATVGSGQFIINRSEFPHTKAVYRARFRVLDQAGNQIGFPTSFLYLWTFLGATKGIKWNFLDTYFWTLIPNGTEIIKIAKFEAIWTNCLGNYSCSNRILLDLSSHDV